jgi:CO/xanthine dehydrogenase Mo-binding subunit
VAGTARVPARQLPGNLNANRRLDRWLNIGRDGIVTVSPGKVELGQGILTALAQIVAEELDVAITRIRIAPANTSHSPDEGTTSGSRSIEEGGIALRYAAAEVRDLLLQCAAQQLEVSMEKLVTRDGVISTPDGRSVSYWTLASDELLQREATAQSVPRPPAAHTIVGHSIERRDLPAKVSGGAVYVQDMELPGMLYGRVVRPPSYGATLESCDEMAARALPGVAAVVRDGSFLAVAAEREEQAIAALRKLQRAAQWRETLQLPAPDELHRAMLAQRSEDTVIAEKGAVQSSFAGGVTLEATYTRPYLAHASIGPSCAVALMDGGRLTVWSHSQGIYPLRRELARALRMADGDVTVIHAESAGCYGHNGADDVALDAALLARALPGRPVKLQWMRGDEFAWEPYGPAMVVKLRAVLNADGAVNDWQHDVWTYPHSRRPGRSDDGVNLLAAWQLADAFAPAPPPNIPPPGGGDRNAVPLYDFPALKVIKHFIPDSPLRVSALRALGAHTNVFAIESFVDELALAAGADPVEFRLRHLSDSRARDVITAAVRNSGWQPGKSSDGRGRGIGFARYKNAGCYIAVVAEVDVERDLRVLRLTAVADAGAIINPDGAKNQIEGGMIQATSWTLKEQVPFDQERVTARSWDDYPILTFAEAPHVEVDLIERADEPSVGMGEAAQGPTTAAIANALCDALGVRVRDLPLTRDRIAAAIENS